MLATPPPSTTTTRHHSGTFEDDPVQEPADHQEDLMHSSFNSDLSNNTTDQYEEFRDDVVMKKATLPIVEAYKKNLSACFPSRRTTIPINDQLQAPSIDVSELESQAHVGSTVHLVNPENLQVSR